MDKWAKTKTCIPGPNLSDDEIDPEDAAYEVNDDSFAEFEEEEADDEATESDAETRHATAAAGSNEASTSQV